MTSVNSMPCLISLTMIIPCLTHRQVLGDRAEHGDRHEHQQPENDDHGPQRDAERGAVGAQRSRGFRRRRLRGQRPRQRRAAR